MLSKKRFPKILLILLISMSFRPGASVSAQRTGLDLLGDKKRIEIPFTESNGLLMIQLRMNGIPLTFLFDTGAENTILFKREIAQLLGLESSRRIRIIGSDLSNTIHGYIVHNVRFKLRENVERIESIIVLEENVYKIQESTGHQVDGLLGGNFFRNVIVKIDYRKNRIIVSHPIEDNIPLTDYQELNSFFIDQKPYIWATLTSFDGQEKEVMLLLDTGSSIPFILHTNVDSSLHLPPQLIRGNLGIGLSGPLIGMIGISRTLAFSDFAFEEILTNFQDMNETVLEQREVVRHGILGNDIMKRFTIVIDYFHRKIYFKPARNYNKAFKYDKSGLVIIASGLDFNEYYIQRVIPGSPADRAGIQEGDKLITLQCMSTSFRSLDNIQNYFRRKPGTNIHLTVQRGSEKIRFHFELEDILRQNILSE